MTLPITKQSTIFAYENKIPEFDDSGIYDFAKSEEVDVSILAESTNTRKETCDLGSLMTTGFIQIPRSLLSHPTVRKCPDAYFRVLFTILENMCFAPCQQDDHGKLIDLQIGQFMCSERELEKLAKVPDSTARRALICFEKNGIVQQEVKHRKKVITLTHPETYELLKKASEARNEAEAKQRRSTKEELNKINNINKKKIYKKEKAQKPEPKVEPEKVSFRDNVFLSQAQFDQLVAENGKEGTDWMIGELSTYKHTSGKDYKSDFHTMQGNGWVLRKLKDRKLPAYEAHARRDKGSTEPSKRRTNELVF